MLELQLSQLTTQKTDSLILIRSCSAHQLLASLFAHFSLIYHISSCFFKDAQVNLAWQRLRKRSTRAKLSRQWWGCSTCRPSSALAAELRLHFLLSKAALRCGIVRLGFVWKRWGSLHAGACEEGLGSEGASRPTRSSSLRIARTPLRMVCFCRT